ncbi:unnamed protein product [Peniophora sp. CBMAI 1063]|nr:unnamed protein product [Peniophora sp. CBMAI 1063]
MAPSADDVERVLNAVGVDVDKQRLQVFLAAIEGKDVSLLIEDGSAKLAVLPADPSMHQTSVLKPPPQDVPDNGNEAQVIFETDWEYESQFVHNGTFDYD